MKRTIIIGAALAVLAGGGIAFAAGDFNSYTATQTFSPAAAGSKAHPSPFGTSEHWVAKGTNGANTAPLIKVVAKVYGEVTNGKDFPTCTAAKINAAGSSPKHNWNKACPGGETGPAMIASGPVESQLESPSGVGGGVPCDPYLYIYNGGQGSQVFFFTETPFAPSSKYTCVHGKVTTGSAPAYTGTITQASSGNGDMWTLTIPLPTTVSTNAGGTGLYASLEKLDVNYAKKTTKKNGKTVAYGASFACKGGQRPYSFTFTAQNYAGKSPHTQTVTISHTASC